MQVIYNGIDIVNDVDIRAADLTMNSGKVFDSLTIQFNDTDNDWSMWKPKINDTIVIKESNVSSGVMYIDTIDQSESTVVIKALPVKKSAKEKHTKSWENVTLFELLNECATIHGLSLKTYDIENYRYSRVNQVNESDFAFLDHRCVLEGYTMKVHDNALVVYDEKVIEKQEGILLSKDELISNFTYRTNAKYKGILFRYGDIEYTFNAPGDVEGSMLIVNDIRVDSIAEAQRFSKDLLINANKYHETLGFETKLRYDMAAGSNINFNGAGLIDGMYYVCQSVFRFLDDVLEIRSRRLLSW